MTYNVFGGMLNLALSLSYCISVLVFTDVITTGHYVECSISDVLFSLTAVSRSSQPSVIFEMV